MIVSYLSEGGTYRPDLAESSLFSHFCLILSEKNGFNVSLVTSCRVKLGNDGIGCVGQAFSPGISLAGKGFSSIGNTGSPVSRLKTKTKPCLVATATASIFFPSRFTVNNCGAEERS